MAISDIPRTIWWQDGSVMMVDQSRLPLVGDILQCDTHGGMCVAIKSMAVRGAPALGVAAAMGVALWAANESSGYDTTEAFLAGVDAVAETIAETRPTAVNLMWGAERIRLFAHANAGELSPQSPFFPRARRRAAFQPHHRRRAPGRG